MTFNTPLIAIAASIATISAVPAGAVVQRHGTQLQRSDNVRATAALRARIGATEARIANAQRSRAITPARAATLRRQVAQTRASMTGLSRQQGFVSAGELASYNRMLGTIDIALEKSGVPRTYGNDMLVGPSDAGRDEERRFDCQNDKIAIAVPGDRLDTALEALSRATRCPFSGTHLALGKRSHRVVGTMTPTQALQTMLEGTGLKAQTIRQGFQIVPVGVR